MSEEKRSFWDSVGKIFRGRKNEIPEGMDFCDNCGKIFPRDELHEVIPEGTRQVTLLLCENCIELPPSSWRARFVYYRKHREE